MKVEGIKEHIEAIDEELNKNPDMQFKVGLLTAKSIALLAATQNENQLSSLDVNVGNKGRMFHINK